MKKKKRLLYDAILLLGVMLVGFAGVKLYRHYADQAASNSLYQQLNEQYVIKAEQRSYFVEEAVPSPEIEEAFIGGILAGQLMSEEELRAIEPEVREIPWYDRIRVNFEALKERNQDVVGWIFFENEDISYPILYSGDNVRYLRKTLDGKSASAGSIFLDGDNAPDFEDSRSVIYGHNMKNLSMFGRLKYYRKEDYYEDHQYFQILVEGKVYRYQIFSYFEVPETETEMCRVDFTADDEFSKYIKTLQKRSMRDIDIEVDCEDKVVTLLTCYVTGRRTLVNAVRVDCHETGAGLQGEIE